MKKILDKIKGKKVIALLFSIIVVVIILINSTYSLLFKTNETDVQSYSTGILQITSSTTNNSITLTNSLPMTDTDGEALTPYTFKIENTGNLTYQFDVKLLSTTTENQIDAQYIKLKVDDNSITTLSSLTEGKILENITLNPEKSIEVSLRVWLDINTPNSQIGKVFNAKIVTEGQAIYRTEPSKETLTNLGLTESSGTPDFSKTSCSSGCDESTVGIYSAEDDLGTSYYFRGDVTNNYVKFGQNSSGTDMYWRIVRINGDGSVRLIYDGTSAHANGESSADRYVGTSRFNSVAGNVALGYMYGSKDASTYEETHANTNDSNIKTYLDDWYKTNIVDTGYSSYVVDAIYCNDRSLDTSDESYTGIGRTTTYYAGRQRLYTNKTPILTCPQANDKFTVSSELGNGKLTYPVGLITADESSFAGGTFNTENSSYYLYLGGTILSYAWTMTPMSYNNSSVSTSEYAIRYNGGLSGKSHEDGSIVRPVISINSSAITRGTGTMTDPFTVIP